MSLRKRTCSSVRSSSIFSGHRSRRSPSPSTDLVRWDNAKAATGLTDAQLAALVAAGILDRVQYERRRHLTEASPAALPRRARARTTDDWTTRGGPGRPGARQRESGTSSTCRGGATAAPQSRADPPTSIGAPACKRWGQGRRWKGTVPAVPWLISTHFPAVTFCAREPRPRAHQAMWPSRSSRWRGQARVWSHDAPIFPICTPAPVLPGSMGTPGEMRRAHHEPRGTHVLR